VGIGTASPEFKLTLDGNGGIIAKGTYDAGASLTTSGGGTKLIWYPKKAAFRAGYVTGGQWDDTNIGGHSIAMGFNNTASGNYATVGGGGYNDANAGDATVGGGHRNTASGLYAAVGGGSYNTASSHSATVGGGHQNTTNGVYATVGGGYLNTASENYGTVPGGFLNEASGYYSFAAGRRAKANHSGTFVWADSTDANFASTANDQFLIGASGGVGVGTTNPVATLDVNGTLAVGNGPAINEISTDGTLAHNSDSAVPTEQAVKTYVDSQVSSSGLPLGVIVMWSGSIGSVPDGWALCNGSNGTPDLRDRFVVGAEGSYSVGSSGGSPSHSHGAGSYSAASHTHVVPRDGWGKTDRGIAGRLVTAPNDSAGNPLETATNDNVTGSDGGDNISGESDYSSNLPPYYALAFIMKL
jgi:hypothetical protein